LNNRSRGGAPYSPFVCRFSPWWRCSPGVPKPGSEATNQQLQKTSCVATTAKWCLPTLEIQHISTLIIIKITPITSQKNWNNSSDPRLSRRKTCPKSANSWWTSTEISTIATRPSPTMSLHSTQVTDSQTISLLRSARPTWRPSLTVCMITRSMWQRLTRGCGIISTWRFRTS